jgi:CheY-like chemotaxis protein
MDSILVIDDESVIRQVVRAILELAGYKVFEAADVATGLDLFRKHKPRLVITDLMMPGIDGATAIREMRSTDPNQPIIVMSGSGDPGEALGLGPGEVSDTLGIVEKPFEPRDLITAVRRILKTG